MRIATHNGGWAVFAHWMGRERPVFGGHGTSVFACLRWRKEQQK